MSSWVENLNTVLDDNEKLCLVSGETIHMKKETRIMMETDTLITASPATITRVGIVHVPGNVLSWDMIVSGWLKRSKKTERHPTALWDRHMEKSIKELFQWLGWPSSRYVEILASSTSANGSGGSNGEMLSPREVPPRAECVRAAHSLSCLVRTFDIMLQRELGSIDYRADWTKKEKIEYIGQVEGIFLFALLWSIGSSLISIPQRQCLTLFLRACLHSSSALKNKYPSVHQRLKSDKWKQPSFFEKGRKFRRLRLPLPESDNWHDSRFVTGTAEDDGEEPGWVPWSSFVPRTMEEHENNREIMVPTMTTTMTCSIIQMLLEVDDNHGSVHVLLAGPAACGKSLLMRSCVHQHIQEDKMLRSTSTIVHTRSTNSTSMKLRLNEIMLRRKGNVYGPENGTKLTLFVEDMNVVGEVMVEKEKENGATGGSSHELLRGIVDHHSVWEPTMRREYVDIALVATLRGGVQEEKKMSPRLLRHFHIPA